MRANATVLQKPELLDSVPVDAIDTLEVKAALFDEGTPGTSDRLVTHISKLTGLKRLSIMAISPFGKAGNARSAKNVCPDPLAPPILFSDKLSDKFIL